MVKRLSLLKRTSRIALGLVLGLLLAGLLLVWAAGTGPALQATVKLAERLSAGQLTVQGAQGSLYGPLELASLRYVSEDLELELKDLALDWEPLALLRGELRLRHVRLQVLRLTQTMPPGANAPAAAPTMPQDLRLPLPVSAQQLQIGRIELQRDGSSYVLQDLRLALSLQQDTYQVQLEQLQTPWGSASATLTLGAQAPHALSGSIDARQDKSQGLPYEAQANITGTLAQIGVTLKAQAQQTRAQAGLQLAPFAAQPLEQLQLEVQGFNPALWQAGLPRADLSATLQLKGLGSERYQGEFALRNAKPAPVDAQGLPLRTLSTRLAGTLSRVVLSQLQLDLGLAGQFAGEGHSENLALQLSLSTRNLNPQGVHSRLQAMKLAGSIALTADARSQQLQADLRYQRYRLLLDAAHQDQILDIRKGTLQSGSASLALQGQVNLVAPQRLQVDGVLKNFDPALFGSYPQARINASLQARAVLGDTPTGSLRFEVRDSQLRELPLSGQGRLQVQDGHLRDSELSLRLAQNDLQARGSFGRAGDVLAFQLDAPRLDLLLPELSGHLQASGTVGGEPMAPSGTLALQAQDVQWGKDTRLAKLSLDARLQEGSAGTVTLQAQASGLVLQGQSLAHAGISGQGRRDRHTIDITLRDAWGQLSTQLLGAWQDHAGWTGEVLTFALKGEHPVELLAPARLVASPQRVQLSDARLRALGATLSVQEVLYLKGVLSTRGDIQGLAASRLQRLASQPAELKTDLLLGGHWDFSVNDRIDGRIALAREQGDVFLPTDPETSLGLQQLDLDVKVVNNLIQGQLAAAGSRLGRLSASGDTQLSRRLGVWGIAGTAPLQLSGDLQVNSLAWVTPLIKQSGALTLDGALQARFSASGTVAQARWLGTVQGQGLKIDLPEQGVHFDDGNFLAELQGDKIVLTRLGLRAGKGTLTGQGSLALHAGNAELQVAVTARELEVLSRADRQLTLSGAGKLEVHDRKIELAGRFKVDRGLIELPKDDAPSPSDDVVVLGRADDPATEPAQPPLLGHHLTLDVDLGERFYLKGQGLDAQLGGVLKVTSSSGAPPRASGTIRVLKGHYAAYGQRLQIDRGILNFQGPVDNPGLNIIALRKEQAVEAGVSVTGTALEPQVRLVSYPNVPDSEKLSWLVLGHGLDDSSGKDFSALQLAAGALLAAGESITLQQRIAQTAGLEEVNLRGTGSAETTVLTLGKRLSSRAYLSYEQGLGGAENLAKINYKLTQRLSVRAQEGDSTALDLFYTFSFD